MRNVYKAVPAVLLPVLILIGCQWIQPSAVDDCTEYSELGQCVARPGWPEAPEEILILTMPPGHFMTEPPVPFSHQVHEQIGCAECHRVIRGQLVERIDFGRT